jgi:Contractile injection system tube protein
MQLQKAIIAVLDGDTEKDSFAVQFNPNSLKLAITNRVEGGATQGKEVRQYLGASSTTLSLELIFDTADEGTSEAPKSVRERTAKLERLMVSKRSGQQENAPPRIRFSWGDTIIEGVLESLTIDFDHFAANGMPLRAKVPLSIRGQDRSKEINPRDSRQDAAAPGGSSGGGLGAGLGVSVSGGIGFGASASLGLGASANIGVALGGESAGEFAARVGVDPSAWRGLQIGGENSLSLSAGVEVGFDVNLNASAGLGVTSGVEAGTSASLEESFGLAANPGLNAVSGVGVGAELASGFALSSGGGLGAAIESVQSARNQSAEEGARSAFKSPPKALPAVAIQSNQPRATSAQPKPPEQARPPLSRTGLPSVSAQQAAPPAPRLPRADARASSFGFGVPLRPTVGEAADRRAESIQGDVPVKPRITSGEPPTTSDPTKPAWVALPARDSGRRVADKLQGKLRPLRPCGCAGRCRC